MRQVGVKRHPRRMMAIEAALLGLTCVVAATAASGAEDAPPAPAADQQIAQGRALAQANCGVCHAVTKDDESPTWVNSNTPFRRLFERFPIPMLEQAARSGIISGHDEMPGFQFSSDEIGALLSYIDSLAPPDRRYLKGPIAH